MEAGFGLETFWCQTPRLWRIAIEARSRVIEREQHGRAWLAWHTVALPRMKKFPTLEKLMGIKRQIKRQTPEELQANIRRMFS